MSKIANTLDEVRSIELDNAFYVEDGKWIESLTISATEDFDPAELLSGISGTSLFYTRTIPTGPTDVTVKRLTLLANESYPFILGIVLRKESIPNRIVYQDDLFEVVVTTREWEDFRELADEIKETLGKFELQSVNQIEQPGEPLDSGRLMEVLTTKLSTEQLEILETAYTLGYFDVPREVSAKELSEELDIAQSTLSERLRTAERALLALIYGPNDF
ncbi:helix-turn-helix domain-containing protein [Halopelagius fulvigenes]|uniref:Helix-turn-helix domain-containing protein n=1 Tax=Halopelagius fulvigenes TaxID=1198324 RepID=A0ABD5TSR4_9EURY